MDIAENLFSLLSGVKQGYDAFIPYELRTAVWKIYHSPFLYLAGAILILERFIPAKEEQRKISAGTWQDFVWFHLDHFFHLTILLFYGEGIRLFYNQYLGFLSVPGVQGWPLAARLGFSFLLFDLMQWVHHYVRHKVRLFWVFHTVHHSQREMNLFTAQRVHLVEFFIRKPITFIPLYMFGANPFELAFMLLLIDWYPRFYHANLKTDLGFLKHILVTPQYHRIHHSREQRHQDKNFGAYTTLWDRLFGTLYENYEEYPDTGIADPHFPSEKKAGFSVLLNYGHQFLYPFRVLSGRSGQKIEALEAVRS